MGNSSRFWKFVSSQVPLNLLDTIGLYCPLIPLVVGFMRWKRLSMASRLVVWLMLSLFVTGAVVYLVNRYRLTSTNLWTGYLFSPFHLLFTSLFYISLLPLRSRLISYFSWAGFFLILIEFAFRGVGNFNSISIVYQCLLFTVLGIYLIYCMAIGSVSFDYALSNGGILLYYMGSVTYYIAFLRVDDMHLLYLLSTWHLVLLILSYIIITFGLWKN